MRVIVAQLATGGKGLEQSPKRHCHIRRHQEWAISEPICLGDKLYKLILDLIMWTASPQRHHSAKV